MNHLSSFPRLCTRRTLAFRPAPSPSTPIKPLISTPSTPSQTRSIPQPRSLNTIATLTTPSSDPSQTAPFAPQPPLRQTSPFLLLGTITRTGTMPSTIQLTTPTQSLNRRLQKHYVRPRRLLAHDPFGAGYLRTGDVVEYGLWSPAEKQAKEAKRLGLEKRLIESGKIRLRTRSGRERKLSEVGVKASGPRWVVRRVVTPFGVGLEER